METLTWAGKVSVKLRRSGLHNIQLLPKASNNHPPSILSYKMMSNITAEKEMCGGK